MKLLYNNLYTISAREEAPDFMRACLCWNAAHPLFEGHFPGHPVIPGACLIQIIIELAERLAGEPLSLADAANVKFLKVIDPQKVPCVWAQLHFTHKDNMLNVRAVMEESEQVFCKMDLCLSSAV